MRCKNCLRTKKQALQSKCWREHQVCGLCAHTLYPEEYPKQFRGGKQQIEIRKKYPKLPRGGTKTREYIP